MKKTFLTIVLIFCIGMCAYAELSAEGLKKAEKEAAEAKKMKKEKDKQLQELRDSIDFHNAKVGLNEQNFVLEAERITFKDGTTIHTQSNTNFISVTEGKAMVQLAFPSGRMGFNGLGGITVQGNASNIKYKTDKRGNVIMSLSVMGTAISATITITLMKGSNQAIATVSPNFNSETLTVYGVLIPNQFSSVFKATPL